jgi:hypothetical protein
MSTLDSSISGINSNSFLSIAEADELFGEVFGSEKWYEFSDEEKSTLLINATNRLQTFVFSGNKKVSSQALNWPRSYVYDYENMEILYIPKKLKLATIELAKWIWEESDRNMTDNELLQYEHVKIGPMDFTPKANAITLPPVVNELLSSIGPGVLISNKSFQKTASGFCR